MSVVVVIPAHNEEERVGRCLEGLRAQVDAPGFEVILVLDRCCDATEERALAAAGDLALEIVESSEPGVGCARKLGMDLACARLAPTGLICTTDADSLVAPDWLAAQQALTLSGSQAIGGLIELDPEEARRLPADVLRERDSRAQVRLAELRRAPAGAASEHHHFSGASIALTAAVYRQVGGLPPFAALEDEALAGRLCDHRIPITRSSAVRVRTSARVDGRAPRGLARDLALSAWRSRRSWDVRAFDAALLARHRRHSVSVVLPAREVAGTIERVVNRLVRLRDGGLIDEILVIDAASRDGTAALAQAAGAHVLQECAILPEFGPALGKGDAMWRGLAACRGEIVVFADTDTENFEESFVVGLLGPLLSDPAVRFVKGAFRRPFRVGGAVVAGEGGRVTELVARPLLNLHWPHLAAFDQPLAGEIAAHRGLLEALPFPAGYGIEIAMLIDAAQRGGVDAMAQVDLGERQNRHQPLRELSAMAYAVLVAATRRLNSTAAPAGPLMLPSLQAGDRMEARPVVVDERPPLVGLGRPPVTGTTTEAVA